MLKEMWEKLDTYTLSAGKPGSQRSINVRNEWGGFSRRLGMPVFTGWQDHTQRVDGVMRCQISDLRWDNKAGVNNQQHWIEHALQGDGEAAFFVIKAADPLAVPRKVEWLDNTRVLVGSIRKEGEATFILAKRIISL